MILRNTLLATAILAGSAFAAAAPASAMPIGQPAGAEKAQIELARMGCGRGFTPNRWGRCVRMMRPHWRGRAYRHDNRPILRKRWEHRR